ncbi:hypothetical protein [Bacillus thuringiensis]|uniref:hypothetical protein n=1 Tax=Bacillus thuringiensis TaxID=1428 RepID=UPI0021B35153|nr:hypothetical protein [Bacillus thuringiensis]
MPVISIILTIFLLIKFDWSGQFTIVDAKGLSHINMYAILALVFGYVILPAILFFKRIKNEN